MCNCTDLGHDDVRRLIVGEGAEVDPGGHAGAGLEDLACGCASAGRRSTTTCSAPGPATTSTTSSRASSTSASTPTSRRTAPISVVPRMWGGVTTPHELRAIADVVEKFDIPMVKVTGGQRIDLLGVKKEDLPAVWADLNAAGMVSGHAYGKALRTVKTCVGTDWCRFGTQDSTGLGIKLEKLHLGLLDAAQGQDGGLRLPAQLRRGDLQGRRRGLRRLRLRDPRRRRRRPRHQGHRAARPRSPTEDEALEIIVAFIQLYREQGFYLERIYKWMERVGLETIRAQAVEDAANRARAVRPLRPTPSASAQNDPWAERASGRRRPRVPADGRLRPAGGGRHERDRPETWVDDRRRADIPLQRRAAWCARRGGDIAVFRTADDEVFALDDRCPHKGGPLSQGIVHGDAVTCPLHNWVIALATGEAQGADEGCVPTIPRAGRATAASCSTGALRAWRRRRLARSRRGPHHLPLLRRRLRRHRRRRTDGAVADRAAIPTTRRISAGSAPRARRWARRVGLEGRLLHPEIGGQRGGLGRGARPRRRAASRETIADARPGLRRLLRLRPAADRGLLRRQQADEGLHRLGQHRHQFAPLHGLGGRRPPPRLRRRHRARLLRGPGGGRPRRARRLATSPGAIRCSSSASMAAKAKRGTTHRRHRPAPHRDRGERRPAPAARARVATSRCSTACSRISGPTGAADRGFVSGHTAGLDAALKAAERACGFAEIAAATGLAAADLVALLRAVRRRPSGSSRSSRRA